MKKIAVLALVLASFNAFAKVELSGVMDKKEFDQYFINSDIAGSVTVNVDVEMRRVDCHGLSEKYSQDVLSTGVYIVTKQTLMHTMQMCRPNADYVATTGISFQIPFKNKFGGSELILVPAGAKVLIAPTKK